MNNFRQAMSELDEETFQAIKDRLTPVLERINEMPKEDLVMVMDFVMYCMGMRSCCPENQKRGCACVYNVIFEEMLKPYLLGAEHVNEERGAVHIQAKRGEA